MQVNIVFVQTEDMNQQSAFKGSSSVGFYVISLLIWVVALCAFATKVARSFL